jgi:hypothetical protein
MGLTRIRAEQISDIDYKQATRVVSLSNVNLSGGAPKIVDGVSLNNNDRVLVAGQGTASQNGLYYVSVAGTGSNGIWIRTNDSNTTGEINAGMIVMVTEGTEYADTSWKLVTDDPIDIGITSLEFLQNTGNSFSIINVVGSSNVVANGVSTQVSFVSGNNISITGNNASDTITFDVVQSPSFTGNVTANYFIGNGSLLTNINASNIVGAYGNANVANYLPTFSGNLSAGNISATGNITGNSLLLYGGANILGNLNVQGNITFIDSNVIVTNDLYIELANNQSTYANINGAGLQVGNTGSAGLTNWTYSTSANAWTTNVGISATGNISGNYIIGDGSLLTNISAGNIVGAYGNANVANYLPTFTGNLSAGNASIVGNVLVGVNISAVGNVTGNNVVVNNTVNWSNNGNVAVYQIYNSSTGSLDTIFN